MRALTLFVLTMFGLAGCQTAPVRYNEQNEGQWAAKALVRNKREGRSAIVHLDVNAVQKEKLRMDVTAALGHPVASLVINGKRLTYVLIDSKQYYQGEPTSAALKPVLGVPLNPKLLYNVFFDLPIEDKSWTCTQDKSGYLIECREAGTELVIRWGERQGRRKLVTIDHPIGLVQINVSSFQPKVGANFELTPPKGFRVIH
jgi:hypothetical protein